MIHHYQQYFFLLIKYSWNEILLYFYLSSTLIRYFYISKLIFLYLPFYLRKASTSSTTVNCTVTTAYCMDISQIKGTIIKTANVFNATDLIFLSSKSTFRVGVKVGGTIWAPCSSILQSKALTGILYQFIVFFQQSMMSFYHLATVLFYKGDTLHAGAKDVDSVSKIGAAGVASHPPHRPAGAHGAHHV